MWSVCTIFNFTITTIGKTVALSPCPLAIGAVYSATKVTNDTLPHNVCVQDCYITDLLLL